MRHSSSHCALISARSSSHSLKSPPSGIRLSSLGGNAGSPWRFKVFWSRRFWQVSSSTCSSACLSSSRAAVTAAASAAAAEGCGSGAGAGRGGRSRLTSILTL
eukprot:1359164-Prymnesium_polylepis.1